MTAGLAATGRHASTGLVFAVVLGLLITAGLWWTYFDSSALSAERRLRAHRDPVLAASDAYSYLHFLLVAGIIILPPGSRRRFTTTAKHSQPARGWRSAAESPSTSPDTSCSACASANGHHFGQW